MLNDLPCGWYLQLWPIVRTWFPYEDWNCGWYWKRNNISIEQSTCYNGSFASPCCEYVIISYKVRGNIPRQIQQPSLEHLHIWKTRTHNFQFPNFNDYYDDFLFENEMNQSEDNVNDNPKRIVPLETN